MVQNCTQVRRNDLKQVTRTHCELEAANETNYALQFLFKIIKLHQMSLRQ